MSCGLIVKILVVGTFCALLGQQWQVLGHTGRISSSGSCPFPSCSAVVRPGICHAGLEQKGSTHLWRPRWWQQFVPPPKAPEGGVLLSGSAYLERSSYGCPAPLLFHLPIIVFCLSGRPGFLPNTSSTLSCYNPTSLGCF